MATAQQPDRPLGEAGPPDPSPRVSLAFEDGSANEDFAWIAARFRELTGATDVILSSHSGGGAPEELATQGAVTDDAATCEEALAIAARATAPARRRQDGDGRLHWDVLRSDRGGPVPVLILTLAVTGHCQILLTALFRNDDDEGEAERAAMQIYPVLVGYFRLWLVARAQKDRLDGFAAALNLIDTAVYLLDGRGALLFGNLAGLALLDAGEGLMRTGGGVTASEMADAVKLRVAIDYFIASGPAAKSGGAAIVRLRRPRGRRPLIAAIMPADAAPRSVDDPALVLLAFDPEQDISALLAPVCQSYGLSPAETRLAGLLIEGLTVRDAALRMRVKVPTLRTYLKQIFGKTGTSRQSDLIRLLMGSLVRIRKGVAYQMV